MGFNKRSIIDSSNLVTIVINIMVIISMHFIKQEDIKDNSCFTGFIIFCLCFYWI